MERKIKFSDIEDREIYDICFYLGVISIHFMGYYYHGDKYELVQPCSIFVPLSDFLKLYKSGNYEDWINLQYDSAKCYISEFETEDGAMESFSSFSRRGDMVLSPEQLPFDKLTINTPCGLYIDYEQR